MGGGDVADDVSVVHVAGPSIDVRTQHLYSSLHSPIATPGSDRIRVAFVVIQSRELARERTAAVAGTNHLFERHVAPLRNLHFTLHRLQSAELRYARKVQPHLLHRSERRDRREGTVGQQSIRLDMRRNVWKGEYSRRGELVANLLLLRCVGRLDIQRISKHIFGGFFLQSNKSTAPT